MTEFKRREKESQTEKKKLDLCQREVDILEEIKKKKDFSVIKVVD